MMQRQAIKQMLAEWDQRQPRWRTETIFKALTSVAPSQLCDIDLFDFAGLDAAGTAAAPTVEDWLLPGKAHTGTG